MKYHIKIIFIARGITNIFLIFTFITSIQATRSIFRPSHSKLPQIETYWKNNKSKTYKLRDTHLEFYPLFKSFNYDNFMSHQIPQDSITYRNQADKSILGSELCYQINALIQELRNHDKKFTHFKLLKNKDFNGHMLSGNIILKFKDYPFVAKVFMENPQSFALPFSKGWQPSGLYIMSGGINRFLAGFTRIRNLELTQEHIEQDHYWVTRLTTPRKWFYLPQDTQWFTVQGNNIGPNKYATIDLPATYVIISDAIEKKGKGLTLFNKKDRELGLRLCKFLGNRIDPHIDNFVIEKDTDNIVIIDTEHFPSMVGLKKPLAFNSYGSWYSQLTKKFIKDRLGRTKRSRKLLQKCPSRVILGCFD